jgi:thioredoxin-related protein
MRNAVKAIIFSLRLAGLAATLFLAGLTAVRAQELTLYMVDQAGCAYCIRWEEEVGDAYHLTAEGRVAPLVRVDLHDALPESVSFARRAVFTPTFVLIRDGKELERIEGYPGEDFFYGLLGMMLQNAGVTPR